MLVREPDEVRVERAHAQLAFRARFVQLGEAHRHVAADDDHLQAGRVARRRDEPETRQ